MAPETGSVVVPLVPRYHWYVSVPVPLAATVSVAVPLRGIVALCGCWLMAVAALTVTAVAADVREQPLAFVTVTL